MQKPTPTQAQRLQCGMTALKSGQLAKYSEIVGTDKDIMPRATKAEVLTLGALYTDGAPQPNLPPHNEWIVLLLATGSMGYRMPPVISLAALPVA